MPSPGSAPRGLRRDARCSRSPPRWPGRCCCSAAAGSGWRATTTATRRPARAGGLARGRGHRAGAGRGGDDRRDGRSLLAQDYPGAFRLVVVDDRSTDGTASVARAAAAGDPRLAVVAGGRGRRAGPASSGRCSRGSARSRTTAPLLLLTDADIRHAPDSLRRLVQRAARGPLVLVSLMARLRCESPAERWLIPAFVFFFQMLYPFRWSNDPARAPPRRRGAACCWTAPPSPRRAASPPIRGA